MVYFCLVVVVICLILMFVSKIKQFLPHSEGFIQQNGTPIKEKEWSYEPHAKRLTIKGNVIPLNEIDYCSPLGTVIFTNRERCYLYATFQSKTEERKILAKDCEIEYQCKNADREKRIQEQKEQVIKLCKGKKIYLDRLCEERDACLNKAVRTSTTCTMPVYEPTYTRGIIKGSLADNVAVMANAQKKKDFEELGLVEAKQKAQREFPLLKEEYKKKAEKIISIIEKYPNVEEYVQYEKQQFSNNMGVLNKVKW